MRSGGADPRRLSMLPIQWAEDRRDRREICNREPEQESQPSAYRLLRGAGRNRPAYEVLVLRLPPPCLPR